MTTPMSATDQRVADIRARLAAAPSGPWWWNRSYELFDEDGDGKHWGLHNAESERDGKVIDWHTVTYTTLPMSGDKPVDQTPVMQLIANAPSDLAFLLAENDALRDELTALRARVATLDERLEEIAKLADHQIPFYAYGDNEAACHMDDYLRAIRALAATPAEAPAPHE